MWGIQAAEGIQATARYLIGEERRVDGEVNWAGNKKERMAEEGF
ncbi:MAG: hypothetical protein ACOXZ0_05225 [Eubacteriales bacterium]|jgi:hypothetical protein